MTVPMPKADSTLPVPLAPAAPAAELESFVINLCSSTTPMALTQPQLVELKQYKFFVSRRLEDGRERFRLHMGYFDSLLQAEELLPVVRDIYPGAWAGEAPGKRLRARAAAAPVAPTPSAAATNAAPPTGGLSAEILANTPTLSAAPALAPAAAPVLSEHAPALKLELVAAPPRSLMSELPDAARGPAVVVLPAPAVATQIGSKGKTPKAAAATTSKRDAATPFDLRSNVREVLKSLDESARKSSAPYAAPVSASPPAAVAMPGAPLAPPVRQSGVLPDAQVLRLLEEKRGDPLNTVSTPAAFAVQLQWSVQSIDLARVPSLAIFGAYTLYTVEGSRDGRRWFGLRLGFFTDANSAKQVAQYVRSEFSSVAVVPVSLKERDGASGASNPNGANGASSNLSAPQRTTEELPNQTSEFKLLDDTSETPNRSAASAAAKQGAKPHTAATAAANRAKTGATRPLSPGRSGGKTARGRGNRVHGNEKRAPHTLEQTLEILGADQLHVEGAPAKLLSEGPIRHLDMKVQKNSPFSRLLDRLAERNR